MNSLKECLNPLEITEALKELPPNLDETYTRMLMSIPEKHRKRVHCIMQLLAVSYQPLTPEQVAEAVAVDYENDKFEPELHRLIDPLHIMKICSSLIMIRKSEYFLFTKPI